MLLKKLRTIALRIFLRAVPQFSCVLSAFTIAATATVSAAAAPISLPALLEPVSNNAVASVFTEDSQYIFSFMGLGEGKTFKDMYNRAWQLVINEDDSSKRNSAPQWQALPPVPSNLTLKGRLASLAVSVKDSVYIFGGYTVDENHNEISTPDVYKYSPTTTKYERLAPVPVPVDDATALVYQDRYVYLVSGWHNDGNVNLVQVYDTQTGQWQQASPFLGNPVFGNAGGIVNNTMVIFDGVSVTPHSNKRRSFIAETACFKGEIDKENPLKIDWRTLQHPTGSARYRMAAAGDEATSKIYFVGGSTSPYNYNGFGVSKQPPDGQAVEVVKSASNSKCQHQNDIYGAK